MSTNTQKFAAWLEIDLCKIRNNLNTIEHHTQKPIMAIVKANAYGHGLVEIAKTAVECGCPWCAGARIGEAMQLREAGLDCKLFVLGYTRAEMVPLAIEKNISLAIYDMQTAQAYQEEAQAAKGFLNVHLKIDSGMGRLGIFSEDALDFVTELEKLPNLRLEGMFTHFARADEPSLTTTQQQLANFKNAVADLEKAGKRPQLVHASNSGATLHFPEAWFDIVRPGIIQYGLAPSSEVKMLPKLQPALTWKSRITSIKTIPAGHGVSYGHEFVTEKPMKIAAIAAGYADGLRRVSGNQVLLLGKRTPVLGRVCMDQCMISLENHLGAKIGDEVVLMGKQLDEEISAEELGKRWGTINYEVIAGLADRLPRVYLKKTGE